MKKIMIYIGCAMLMMLSFSVSANASSITAKTIGDKVYVEIMAQAEEPVTCVVFKHGMDAGVPANIAGIHEGVADQEGKICFTFEIKSDTEKYEVVAAFQNAHEKSLPVVFDYMSERDRNRQIERIKDATDADVLKQLLSEDEDCRKAVEAIGANLAFYDGLSEGQDGQKKEFVSILKKGVKDVDESQFLKLYCNVTSIIKLNHNVSEPLADADISFDGKNITEFEGKNWIIDEMRLFIPYDDVIEFCDEADRAYKLYQLKTARFSEIGTLLDSYKDALGIAENSAYEKYLSLKSAKQTEVNEKLVQKIKNKSAFSVDSLMDILNEIIKEVNQTSDRKGGGSGGGGYSGGNSRGESTNSSGIVPVTPVLEKVDVYDDIGGYEWAEDAIKALTKKNIIAGDGNGKFYPERNITRNEFVKMLVMAIGKYNPNAKSSFSDIPQEHWSGSYVASAVDAGIVKGISESEFGDGMPLTREDMAVIIYRTNVLKYKNSGNSKSFLDDGEISDYAREAIYCLYHVGIIKGMSEAEFAPKQYATRAQAAKLVYEITK